MLFRFGLLVGAVAPLLMLRVLATSPPPSPSSWTLYTPPPPERNVVSDRNQVTMPTRSTVVAKNRKPTKSEDVQAWRDRLRARYVAANKVPAALRSSEQQDHIEKFQRHLAGKRESFARWRTKLQDSYKESKAIPAEQRDEQQRAAFERGGRIRKSRAKAKKIYRQRQKEKKKTMAAMASATVQETATQEGQ